MPLEKLSTASTDPSATTATLDGRVRRLERIIATSAGNASDEKGDRDQSRDTVALQRISAAAEPLRQLTREVESQRGVSRWDAADVLAARLLLDALSGALRSCRVVSDAANGRLHEVERRVRAARKFVARGARRDAH